MFICLRSLCDHCSKTFSRGSNLKTHVKTVHMLEKLFTCDHCSKTFSQGRSLKNHVRNFHVGVRSLSAKLVPHQDPTHEVAPSISK